MPEYLDFRCCMCPNAQNSLVICPGIVGTLHPEESSCRFVKSYIDSRGWKYKVIGGIVSVFKARYLKPDTFKWVCMRNLNWKNSFDEAQADLNRLAKKNNWNEVEDK
jgi:hypothetical protein